MYLLQTKQGSNYEDFYLDGECEFYSLSDIEYLFDVHSEQIESVQENHEIVIKKI